MKKIVFSALAALTIGTVAASAGDVKLYSDGNGQVFTMAGEGRTLIKNIDQKSTSLFAKKSSKIKFGGKSYLNFTNTDYEKSSKASTSKFALNRLYFDVKAYLLQDPKSYFRVTFDRDQDNNGVQQVIVKYGYLYLNDVLPYTGVEIGQAHRPWVDYEQNNSWAYRSIQKVFAENKNSANLTGSTDLGANFKTKTKYFSSEIGLFQGEGYKKKQAGDDGVSLEWRATAHLLGENGKGNATKKTYWEASFYGQYNAEHNKNANGDYDDLVFYGLHTVFNTPSFQVAGQYISSADTADNNTYVSEGSGTGYNAHALARLGAKKEFAVFARLDNWKKDQVSGAKEYNQNTYTYGASWQQNKNIQWVANVITTDNEDDFYYKDNSTDSGKNSNAYMLTAEVKF